jgi:outer membrane cobalamin receptor
MLRIKYLIIFLVIFQSVYSQSHTISGYVSDMNTGERIIGAYVTDSLSKSVSQTNNFGFYVLKNLGYKSILQATYIGLKSKAVYLSILHDTLINISMQPALELKEVVISTSMYKHNVNSPLGLNTIPTSQLISVPALGEPDLIKSIQSQPGIKGGVEGSAGIYVRGGSAGENLFMLDDVPIYNISHLYGFFSTFNSSVVKDIKLLKGCFPARYGGRVSSIVDVRSRDGNNKSIQGEVSIGIISSILTLEGPLLSDKTTFVISGRRSYFDLYSGLLKQANLLDTDFPGYYFYDLNARLTHTFSQKDKIFLSIYKGNDKIRNKKETTLTSDIIDETSGWGNIIGSLRWNHTFGGSLFLNTTIACSRYNSFTLNRYKSTYEDSTLNRSFEKKYVASYKAAISDIIVKTDFDYYISNNHKLMFGAGNTFHTFSPGENTYSMSDQKLNEQIDTSFTNKTLYASEPFFYAEDELSISDKVRINTGLRLSGFVSDGNMYFNAEPRLSINFNMLPGLVLKSGYSRMVQYMHLLTSSGLTMPDDIWVPALKGLLPLKSDQINAGVAYDLDKIILFSIELYFKWLNNTADYRNGSSLLADLSPWYEKTTQGQGTSRGIEVSVEKQEGRLTGSINYTLSTASRKYADLNNGKTFPFDYDRLHDLNISANYHVFKKWDLSVLWVYGSGYPVTLPVEKYFPALGTIGYNQIYYLPSLNNCRLPAYHRLDMGIHFKTQTRLGEQILSFDVFNAYDRKNPVNMYFNGDSFKYSYLLPIIPSVTYTLKFR